MVSRLVAAQRAGRRRLARSGVRQGSQDGRPIETSVHVRRLESDVEAWRRVVTAPVSGSGGEANMGGWSYRTQCASMCIVGHVIVLELGVPGLVLGLMSVYYTKTTYVSAQL